MSTQMNSRVNESIDNCQRAHDLFLEAIPQCLEMGGDHSHPEHIKLLIAGAETCAANVKLMLLGSPHHVLTSKVCADVCDAIADDSSEFDDYLMNKVAKEARRCANSLRQISRKRASVGGFRSAETSFDQRIY